MGLDYIRKVAGNFKKAWNHGAQQIAAPDLFTSHPACAAHRSILAERLSGSEVIQGEQFILQYDGRYLSAYRDTTKVASCNDAPADLVTSIREAGGVALVKVEKIYKRANTLRLSIKE